jgi:hypothetical protein
LLKRGHDSHRHQPAGFHRIVALGQAIFGALNIARCVDFLPS